MQHVSEILDFIPADSIKFLLVALFSLLIGMEQRRHHLDETKESLFGTDRTFTLIGILGYILYVLSPKDFVLFLFGAGIISVLLAIYYYQKMRVHNRFGMTTLVIALITYCLAPLIYTQPNWLVILIIVVVLVITEMKETLFKLSRKFDNDEFITLAKFLAVAGVVLPLLPDTPISNEINISPYKFWLAIVVVSCISYVSYILKKFVFPNSGIILTGILGGLYSSTATTIILARKSNDLNESNKVATAIILATTMMYLRIFLLAFIFNKNIAYQLIPSFLVFIVATLLVAIYSYKFQRNTATESSKSIGINTHNNPLEFKTALVFAGLFILFGLITGMVNTNYGTAGINVLSFIVGVTDIDPFILNLFQSKWNIDNAVLVTAVLNAVTSNNLLKMIYGLSFGNRSIRKSLIIGFGLLIVLGLLMAFVIHL